MDESLTTDARRRIDEVEQRLAELAEQREQVEGQHRALSAELQELEHQASRVAEERAQLEAATEAFELRIRERAEEAEELRQEVPLLDRRAAENLARRESLQRQIAELEDEILGWRGEMAATRSALRLIQDSVARMDRKLAIRGQGSGEGELG